MKKLGKVLLVFLMCFGLFGCGSSKKSVADIEKQLKEVGIESYTYKYEFKADPSIGIRDTDDGGITFSIGKETIELKQYEKDFKDKGGITFYYFDDDDFGIFTFNKEKVVTTDDYKESSKGKKKLDEFLKKADITQEELFDYIIEYGNENLFTQTKEDKMTTEELIKENKYTYYAEDNNLFIEDGDYTLAVSVENDKISSAFVVDKTDIDVMLTVPYTSTLGTNIFYVSSTKSFYDLDKEKVMSGTTVTKANITEAKKLQTQCFDMLRKLHITTPNELKEVYKELTK